MALLMSSHLRHNVENKDDAVQVKGLRQSKNIVNLLVDPNEHLERVILNQLQLNYY